jgi:hypothetical protein
MSESIPINNSVSINHNVMADVFLLIGCRWWNGRY